MDGVRIFYVGGGAKPRAWGQRKIDRPTVFIYFYLYYKYIFIL